MTEQETAEKDEQELENSLLAWLQGFGEQTPSIISMGAMNRLDSVGVSKDTLELLRTAILNCKETYQIPLWLYFSGFNEAVLDTILGGEREEVIRQSIVRLGLENPGLSQEQEVQPPQITILPQVGSVALKEIVAKPARTVRTARRTPLNGHKKDEAERTEPPTNEQDVSFAEPGDVAEPEEQVGIVTITRRRPDVDDDEDAAAVVLGGPDANPDLVNVYLKEIGRTPLLNAEQEVILSKRIEAGLYAQRILDGSEVSVLVAERGITVEELQRIAGEGEEAMNHMVQANLRLVVSIARRSKYHGKGLELLDLISEGNFGLIRAVEKFDFAKGFKFSTYATWWLTQAISRGLANIGDTIRLPVHTKELVYKVQGARSRLLQENGYEPSVEELANECNVTQERVIDIIRIAKPILSLDQQLNDRKGDPGDTERVDLIAAPGNDFDDMIHNQLNADVVRHLLGVLDLRTASMVSLRHGLIDGKSYTLDEIGVVHHLTKERVRQLLDKAMTKLRGVVAGTSLLDHLDK